MVILLCLQVETDFLEDKNGDAGEDGSGKHSTLFNCFADQTYLVRTVFKSKQSVSPNQDKNTLILQQF